MLAASGSCQVGRSTGGLLDALARRATPVPPPRHGIALHTVVAVWTTDRLSFGGASQHAHAHSDAVEEDSDSMMPMYFHASGGYPLLFKVRCGCPTRVHRTACMA